MLEKCETAISPDLTRSCYQGGMRHHIFCGDCAADAARPHLPEPIHVRKDSSSVGPCSPDPDTHRRLRAAWWAIDPSEIQRISDLPADGELVLWFGPDPWEQIALLELLAGLDRDASLVHLACSVTDLAPADFPALLAARRPAPDLAPLRALWHAFCADDHAALAAAATTLRHHPDLPHLGPALTRVLADRRDHLTERRVRELVAAGTRDVPALMRALAAREAPHHGAWFGDSVVTRLRDAALAS
jgi:hypothetical protein